MEIILLGPPGAGKGTQADQLHSYLQIPHVASGDLFRDNLQNQTELGMLAKVYMDKGQLVPDDGTIAMVKDRLQKEDCTPGVILDGFPRTVAQAEGLDLIFHDLDRSLNGVLYIAVPDDVLIDRISGRWICRDCQTPFHTTFSPPKVQGVCDACGGELYQRDDDKPETVKARLRVFHEQTAPLIQYYREKDLLIEIDGSGDIEAVAIEIRNSVNGLNT